LRGLMLIADGVQGTCVHPAHEKEVFWRCMGGRGWRLGTC
jgi:hypothetical protein